MVILIEKGSGSKKISWRGYYDKYYLHDSMSWKKAEGDNRYGFLSQGSIAQLAYAGGMWCVGIRLFMKS